ncbi:MAG: reactive intermediate/imine deaminase [Nitrospinota bacterium]|nr:MAG: reactive intermediate/imine deaminase [Nitrospinota bacterium]
MERKVITTATAPQSSAPLSQAIQVGNFLYVSGQVGVNPRTGEIPTGIEAQTRQTLENMQAVLEAAGSSLEKVVKATVFLTDMQQFAQMNAVYKTFFPQNPPARSCVGVSALARPEFVVEIECIAVL